MTVATWDEPEADVGLGVWAAELRSAAEISASLARTPFVPQSLRVYRDGRGRELDVEGTAAVVTAVLLTGREVGLSPMAALRSVDIINGTPAMRAATTRALVLARGHDMWLVESTQTRCIIRGQRRGSDHTQEIVWTLDRAKLLGLTGKPNWRTQPQAMLVARATAELARLIAPEALLGLPYVVEELGDDATPEDADANLEPARKRTARRKVRPVVEAQLPPDPTTPAPEPVPPADEQPPPALLGVTPDQIKAMGAAFSEAGMTDRDDALAYVSSVIGRDVASRNDLTRGEASEILDALKAIKERPDPNAIDHPQDVRDSQPPPADPWADPAADPGDPWGNQ
jgi:hypothetical protein